MTTDASKRAWLGRFRLRLGAHWRFKALAIPLGMSGFFVAYFYLLKRPLFPVSEMPLHWLDGLVAFHPAAILPYASLWIYVTLAPALLLGKRELGSYCVSAALLAIAGLGIFLFWPTRVPPLDVDWSLYPSLAFLKSVDAGGNACPSLHVAFSLFTAVWLDRLLRAIGAPSSLRFGNALWSVAIVYSTLATKQHVAWDVVAGGFLGLLVGLLNPRVADFQWKRIVPALDRQFWALSACGAGKLAIVALGLWRSDPLLAAFLFFVPDLWILYGLLVPNNSLLVPTATRFATEAPLVWLTIDDGPEPGTTPSVLDLLDKHGARCTFFVIGAKAAAHPELVEEILRRGHTLGNHTRTHPLASFWLAGPSRTAREIDGWQAALDQAGARAESDWFRPPAGVKTLFLRGALAKRNLSMVGWSARGRECVSSSIEGPLRRLKRLIRPGAILLVHEIGEQPVRSLDLLSSLLDHLSAEGYRCTLPARTDLR